MYLILSSGDQNNIPSRQLDLHECLCFPRGNSIVLFSEPPQLSEHVLFAEPVYLWVGEGEDMQCAVCGRVNREHTYTAVKTKATWRVSYANAYFGIWSSASPFRRLLHFQLCFHLITCRICQVFSEILPTDSQWRFFILSALVMADGMTKGKS